LSFRGEFGRYKKTSHAIPPHREAEPNGYKEEEETRHIVAEVVKQKQKSWGVSLVFVFLLSLVVVVVVVVGVHLLTRR
jgi:hypothetical protein